MNFRVKMVSIVQNKSIIWLVLDQKRFTGKIRIEFYIGGQSSNFLKFKFYSVQMCYLNVTQKFVWVIDRALQKMSTDVANCVIIQGRNEVSFFIADPVILPKFLIPGSKRDENFNPLSRKILLIQNT